MMQYLPFRADGIALRHRLQLIFTPQLPIRLIDRADPPAKRPGGTSLFAQAKPVRLEDGPGSVSARRLTACNSAAPHIMIGAHGEAHVRPPQESAASAAIAC